MAHVRLERLDVQLLARMPLDRRTHFAVEVDLARERGAFRLRVARVVKHLRHGGKGAHKGDDGFVK